MELEHEMFRNAKAANLYKASVLKKVGGACSGSGWERWPLHTPKLAATLWPRQPRIHSSPSSHSFGGSPHPPFASQRHF